MFSEKVLQSMCQQLYILATKYQVPLLIAACEQAIITYALNISTAASILQFVDIYGTDIFQQRVMKYFYQREFSFDITDHKLSTLQYIKACL